MLPSFLQKVEVVSEASRETCVALSACLNLFTKQEGVGSLELNFSNNCLGVTLDHPTHHCFQTVQR